MQRTLMAAVALGLSVFAIAMLFGSSTLARAQLGTPVAATCPEAEEARYFPVGVFAVSHWKEADSTVRRWYSKHLTAMEEPSLSCGSQQDSESYRFLWLRSFHNPIAVRIGRRGDVYGLVAVVLDGAGGYKPGKIAQRVTKILTPDQSQTMLDRLEYIKFWIRETKFENSGGRDGAQWIVEARRDGRYHVVDRWSGDYGLESVGKLFLDLAGLGDVEPVY